jgi:hypothetical protein
MSKPMDFRPSRLDETPINFDDPINDPAMEMISYCLLWALLIVAVIAAGIVWWMA